MQSGRDQDDWHAHCRMEKGSAQNVRKTLAGGEDYGYFAL
jgi:hypothetical protein